MSEENNDEAIQLADPLAALGQVNMSEVSTDMPLLPEGPIMARIESYEVVPSKKVDGNHNLLVHFATTEEVQAHTDDDSEGQILPIGWKVRKYFPLQHNQDAKDAIARGEKPKWDFRSDLARLQDAVLGCDKESRPNFNMEDLVNGEVLLRIGIEENEDNGMIGNTVKGFKHPA